MDGWRGWFKAGLAVVSVSVIAGKCIDAGWPLAFAIERGTGWGNLWGISASRLVIWTVTLLVTGVIVRWLCGGTLGLAVRRMGLDAWNRHQLIAAAMVLGILGAVRLAGWHLGRFAVTPWYPDRTEFAAVVVNVLLIVAYEELIYRGFVFTVMRRRASFLVAAGVSSALWGLSHWPEAGQFLDWGNRPFAVLQIAGPFLVGFPLAWLRERGSGSLYGPILVHIGQAIWQVFHAVPSVTSPAWTGSWGIPLVLVEMAVVAVIVFTVFPVGRLKGRNGVGGP